MARDYKEIVRALLAKAASTDSPDEALALQAKAAELMAKHSIDLAMVVGVEGGIGRRTFQVHGTAASDRTHLLWACMAGFDVDGIRIDRPAGGGYTMHLFGAEHDVESVIELFERLDVHMAAEQAKAMDAHRARAREALGYWESLSGTMRSFAHAFRLAYASRVRTRLRRVRLDAEQYAREVYGDGALPVLADRRSQVEQAVKAAFPRVGKTTSTVSSSRGIAAGRAAADRASLGRSVAAGGPQALTA